MKAKRQMYTMYIYDGINGVSPYVRGQVYYFHEDEHPGEEFTMVVDAQDMPVKVFVRY